MIKVEVQGNSGDDFMQGILEEFADEIGSRVQGLRCPVHGDSEVILRVISGEDEMSVRVEACCDQMGEQVMAAIDAGEDE